MGKCAGVHKVRMLTTMIVVITITTNNDYWKLRIQHLMRKGIGKCTGVHKVGRKRFCLLPNHCNPSALFFLFAPFALYALCTYTLHYLHFALFALYTIFTFCTMGSMLLADGSKSRLQLPKSFVTLLCAQGTASFTSPPVKRI